VTERGTYFVMALVALLIAQAAGCTTFRPVVPDRAAITSEVGIGDRVELVTTSGTTIAGTVSALTQDAMILKDAVDRQRSVSFADITELFAKKPARGRTTGLALGIAAAIAAIQLRSGEDILSIPGAPTMVP
jgi:hypothetical protein